MSIQRWDPFQDILSLREAMDRMIEESFARPRAGVAAMGSGMAMDLKENDDAFVLETVLPGVKPEDVDISILNDTVRIKAEVTDTSDREGENWLVRERRYGRFERSIVLPSPVNADNVNAEYEDGILRMTLPKSEGERPKSIKVASAKELKSGEKSGDKGKQQGNS
jgi:HSP20 family protein